MLATMRVRWKVAVLSAAVVVGTGASAVIGAAGTADAATLPGGTWGVNQPLPGEAVGAIACTALGDCVAVGYSVTGSGSGAADVPITVTETAGTWGSAQRVSGAGRLGNGKAARLTGISCGATGYCTAAGTYNGTDNESHAWYVTEAKGTWGTPTAVSQSGQPAGTASAITGVSCPAAGYCAAVGNYTPPPATATSPGTSIPFLLDEADGSWGAPRPVPGLSSLSVSGSKETMAWLESVSCATAGTCTAAGGFRAITTGIGSPGQAFVVSETKGAWDTATAVGESGGLESIVEITSVSCPDASDCTAAGVDAAPLLGPQPFTIDEAKGTWGTEDELASEPSLYSVNNPTLACAAVGDCVLATTGQTEVVADSEASGGHWGTVTPIAVPAGSGTVTGSSGAVAACAPGGDCTIVGSFEYASKNRMFAVTSKDGVLGKAQPVVSVTATTENIADLACPQSGYCTLVYDLSGKSGSVPEAVNEATAATVTLKASVSAATYGNEPSEKVTVNVSSPDGGTPTGTVTVTAPGGGKLCTITLAGGKGSCTDAKPALPAGKDTLTGTYRGNEDYVAARGTATVAVQRAATSTALTLSKPTVTYGHESAEKLTVKVSHVGSGYATGKVAVRAGKTTICTITLRKGTGSCTLSGKRLKDGSYKLVAVFAGNADYNPSTSPGKVLKVVA